MYPNGTFDRVGDNNCRTQDKPVAVQQCGRDCPVTVFSWVMTEWSECSAVCGPGKQVRNVFCQRTVSEGGSVISTDPVADSRCSEQKPPNTMDCDAHCEYDVGFWSRCSVSCGTGTQTRRVECLKTETNGRQLIVNLGYCVNDSSIVEPLPSSERECGSEVCAIPPLIRRVPTSAPPPPKDTDLNYSVRQDVYVMKGRSLMIDCVETQAEPEASMKWTLSNGRVLRPGEVFGRFRVTNNATLIIVNTTINDDGLYVCMATNIAGTSTASSRIRVYGKLHAISAM